MSEFKPLSRSDIPTQYIKDTNGLYTEYKNVTDLKINKAKKFIQNQVWKEEKGLFKLVTYRIHLQTKEKAQAQKICSVLQQTMLSYNRFLDPAQKQELQKMFDDISKEYNLAEATTQEGATTFFKSKIEAYEKVVKHLPNNLNAEERGYYPTISALFLKNRGWSFLPPKTKLSINYLVAIHYEDILSPPTAT